MRVVIVTLDNHLSGAVERAGERLRADGISIGFHAASDWDRHPHALERARADIARGDIVIATMMFLDDHIRTIAPDLEARREHCDAMLGMMSGAEVVRLTRLGNYRMDAPARGPMALLKKLRGGKKPGGSSGAGQMKMLRRLPKILRFIPGAAQDLRAYFLTLQYWLAGSDDNVVSMIRALVDRYADGERRSRRGTTPADPPRDYPEVGRLPPCPAGADRRKRRRASCLWEAGTVGLLMLRSYLLGRDTGIMTALSPRWRRAAEVVPAFASGLDSRPAIERFFHGQGTRERRCGREPDRLLVGRRPGYNDADAAAAMLTRLDVPYIAAHPIEFQTMEQWGERAQGLLPIEATMMVAIPSWTARSARR
jgi:magnesium chelatase subunit H